MREIKFRAWDKKKNGLVSRNEWLGGALSPSIDTISICSVWQHFNIEIMQYTGLKDKNGKEIYEGDILKIEVQDFYYDLYEVSWNNNKASFSLTELGSEYEESFNDWLSTETFTVIGNIYENSELLN